MPEAAVTEPVSAQGRDRGRLYNLLSAAFLCLLISFCVPLMWSSVVRPWFFNSDEYVLVGEVIRFVQLDFRQHFFDMPGTPLMFITALLWTASYSVQTVLGIAGVPGGIAAFTFQRLPALFMLMRAETLFFFLLSIVLLFWLTAKLTNRTGACVASLMLAMSPIYTMFSAFIRVESLSVCCVLGSLLCVVYHFEGRKGAPVADEPRRFVDFLDLIFFAGVLAGFAAAARLHSITASIPVLVLFVLASRNQENRVDYPQWVKLAAGGAAILLAISAPEVFRVESRFGPLPHARSLLVIAWSGAVVGLAVCVAMYFTAAGRRLLVQLVDPSMVRLLIGCGVGLLAGMPTVIRQREFFKSSMEMYSTARVDVARAALPFGEHLRWYLDFYLGVIAPDKALLVLLIAGSVCIAIRRDWRLLAIAAGAALFFVSKPMSLLPDAHHVILWLPFYAIICSYPVALLAERLSALPRYGGAVAGVFVAVVVGTLCLSMTPGPRLVPVATSRENERLDNVARASDWIKRNTETGATIAVSIFCFNGDIFLQWLRFLEVPVPASVAAGDGRDYLIWWGFRSSLRGKAGYALATARDVAVLKDGTNPFSDTAFRALQTFGAGENMVTVFRFDESNQ